MFCFVLFWFFTQNQVFVITIWNIERLSDLSLKKPWKIGILIFSSNEGKEPSLEDLSCDTAATLNTESLLEAFKLFRESHFRVIQLLNPSVLTIRAYCKMTLLSNNTCWLWYMIRFVACCMYSLVWNNVLLFHSSFYSSILFKFVALLMIIDASMLVCICVSVFLSKMTDRLGNRLCYVAGIN